MVRPMSHQVNKPVANKSAVGGDAPRSASPPTDRVLDVLELLARSADTGPIRLADLARQLGLSPATAHAIVTTLCERGWAERDPLNRGISIGPTIDAISVATERARPLAHLAREAARALSDELGFATSVTELLGDEILLTYFGSTETVMGSQLPGQRIPFTAPFGTAFAAWAPDDVRRRWIDAVSVDNAELSRRLGEFLNLTRTQGFSVERMPLGLARTAQLMRDVERDRWSGPVHRAIDEALVEVATAEFESGPEDDEHPVTAISAPVFDGRGAVSLNVGVHPFAGLSRQEVAAIGGRIVAATTSLSEDR